MKRIGQLVFTIAASLVLGCSGGGGGGGDATTTDTPPRNDTPEPPACSTEYTSNLPGVDIVFTGDECEWTLAEAQAGITIPYEVRIDENLVGVAPQPQDAGDCDTPGESGLILIEILEGGDERYCVCDVGLCREPDGTLVEVKAGVYAGQFQWDGKNWGGPSDTGNPKGLPFPAGTYELTVSAKGNWTAQEGFDPSPFLVDGVLTITLVE